MAARKPVEDVPMFVLADGKVIRPEVAAGLLGGLKIDDKTAILPALARWTRYTGARKPCDACVQRIHRLGVTNAPAPAPASHKRIGPNSTLLLCNEDGQTLKTEDDRVAREAGTRVADQKVRGQASREKAKTQRQYGS